MGKIVILTVGDDEEKVVDRIQEYLISKGDFKAMEPIVKEPLIFSGMTIDPYHRKVVVDGNLVDTTDLEFRLLSYLASQPGRVFTYQQIYEAVWGEEYAYEKGNIMSHIHHIREKIEEDSKDPKYIENIRGVGYRFIKNSRQFSQ